MNRKQATDFLSKLLIKEKLSGIGKYYASEVVVDYGTNHPRRVDFMEYIPAGACYAGDIERGTFCCYEIKSCKEDVYSGNGLNFLGEENYIVTTAECYKSLMPDMQSGKLQDHIDEMNGFKSYNGFLIAVPDLPRLERFNPSKAIIEELENPHQIDGDVKNWRLAKLSQNYVNHRRRSTTELLFCMVRSGR